MTPLAAVGLLLMFLIWDYMRTYTAARHIDQEVRSAGSDSEGSPGV